MLNAPYYFMFSIADLKFWRNKIIGGSFVGDGQAFGLIDIEAYRDTFRKNPCGEKSILS